MDDKQDEGRATSVDDDAAGGEGLGAPVAEVAGDGGDELAASLGRPDMTTLQVQAMVAHVVPQRKKDDDSVTLTLMQAESPMPAETKTFLARRLARSLSDRGHLSERDPANAAAPVPPQAQEFLAGGVELVAASHLITQHLFAVQGGSSNPGVLIMLRCALEGQPAVAILKVEHETGVQLEEIDVNGQPALDLNVLENLLLTENTRTFKAALLYKRQDRLVGLVVDEQQNDKRDIASFFHRKFLGMRLMQTTSVITERFYRRISEYSNSAITDLPEREAVIAALNVEMRATGQIDPIDFVERHVPEEHQDALVEALKAQAVPVQPFDKDLERIKSTQIDRAYWLLDDGIKVQGPRAQVRQRVRSVTIEGQSGVFVRGDVQRIN